MNLSNAVGVVAGLALVTVLGISVLTEPESSQVVTVDQGDTSSVPRQSTTTAPPVSTSTSVAVTVPAAPRQPTGSSPATNPGSVSALTGGTISAAPDTTPASESAAPAVVTSLDKTAAQVGVVNSSGKPGVATATATRLAKVGWSPHAESVSWPASPFSVVFYGVGKLEIARAVAASLGLPDSLVLPGEGAAPWNHFASAHYDVLVLAGKDLR